MSTNEDDDRIKTLRTRIDALDDKIADALAERHLVVTAIREEKAKRGIAFIDLDREAEIERRYRKRITRISLGRVHALVRAVLESCR
jgi:chorismate mutase